MCDVVQWFFFKQVNLNILFVDTPKLQMGQFKKHSIEFAVTPKTDLLTLDWKYCFH